MNAEWRKREIEAGRLTTYKLYDGTVIYPTTTYGYEDNARSCLALVASARNKYDVWFWQSHAAEWYKMAAKSRAGAKHGN